MKTTTLATLAMVIIHQNHNLLFVDNHYVIIENGNLQQQDQYHTIQCLVIITTMKIKTLPMIQISTIAIIFTIIETI